ncbi:response regulator [Thorsellia anophelis]|uniref:Two-component system, OmpR family, response regulator n=1 Tax=Thorsellia anophelis DSM 18579 TaxID=1123402 RepID=A0A1I0EXL6_9GAMM|nr:response regulator [Thorsellia anophelis]SET50410.1 two-component system, OmpR family, response regulator [Thorsellia anophelis DSM 18579]
MRILLIEDDKLLARSIITALTKQGLTVDWLDRGANAHHALKQESFSAVLLDLTLPDIDGLIVLKKIRQSGESIPVIILTARDDIKDRVNGLDAGADDYLGKPFAVEELLARIRVHVRRQSGNLESKIVLDKLSLDMSQQRIEYQEIEVKLTKNEYKILSTLILHANKVMTKESLQQTLNGWDELASENVIEVHLHHIRKKLPDIDIRNIRGVGYILST